jgi:hypothetical protein
MADGDEDPWDFLSAKKRGIHGDDTGEPPAQPAPVDLGGVDALAALVPPARSEKRERGQLRGEMGGPSLRRRAWPMALSLALLAFGGYLTEVVASSQVLARSGSGALLIIFPLGGLGLILIALAQFRFVDHRARLPLIRAVSLGYGLAFALAAGLLWQSIVPALAAGLAWLLADQLNFLMPLLIWSLASDEFNVAESRKIYPWIVTWTYGGQVLGLALSAVSPWLLAGTDIPLTVLLVLPALMCVAVAILLPRAMRTSNAAKGSARPETTRQALASAREFIDGVPVWRQFLLASVLTFIAGGTLYLVFLANAEQVVGSDAAGLQTLLGWAGLAWFLVCFAIQTWGAERLQNRIGIPGVLLILPFSLIVGGVLLALGSVIGSLGVLVAGVSFWIVPRWSIDENARRSALALVPDERRARVSFVVDLLPIALGMIISGPLAVIGIVTGELWIVAGAATIIAIIAIVPSQRVRREWEDSLLNWRLRRRKQNRALDLD